MNAVFLLVETNFPLSTLDFPSSSFFLLLTFMIIHPSIPLLFKTFAIVVGSFLGGFYFTTLFHAPTSLVGGLWAVISAIIVLESSHAETFASAKFRLIGSFLGAFLSGVYLYFFTFSILGLTATIGLGVIICYVLRLSQSVKLTGVTIAVIVIVSTLEHSLHPFLNAGLRFVECAIGTAAAVLVALIADSALLKRISK